MRSIFWLTGFWFLWKIPLCTCPAMPKEYDVKNKNNHRVSVIIPARNEETNLPQLFESLLAQTVKPYEIILVNDQSTDRTAEIAGHYKVRIINIENLPDGWLGKPWACFTGAKNSSGDVFLFLDADTKLHVDGLEKLLLCYLKYKGVISVQPYHKIKKLYENFASCFNLVLMRSMNVFTPLQFKVKPIGAFGPCLLCDKKSYFAIGGHSSAKAKILEDLEIGKKFIKNNVNVYCFGGKGTVDFRMYPYGISSIVNGFARGFSTGARETSIFNLFLIILWIAGSFYPITLLFGSIFNFNQVELITGTIFYIAYAVQIFWMIRRIGNFSPIVALFFPVFLVFFILIFLWSVIVSIFRINIKWKDRPVNNKAGKKRK